MRIILHFWRPSERQRNIIVELTLADRTAQYIADRIVRFLPYDGLEKGIGKLVGVKDRQVVVVQRKPHMTCVFLIKDI